LKKKPYIPCAVPGFEREKNNYNIQQYPQCTWVYTIEGLPVIRGVNGNENKDHTQFSVKRGFQFRSFSLINIY